MAEKEEVPRHEVDYDKFKKEVELVNKTRDTMEMYHYNTVSKWILDPKKGIIGKDGNIDTKLMKGDKKKEVIDNIVNEFDVVLKNYYGTSLKDIPDGRKEMVRQNLLGVNKNYFNTMVDWKKFNLATYKETAVDKYLEHLVGTMAPGTYAHINPADMPKVLKLAKLDDKFDEKMLPHLGREDKFHDVGRLLYSHHASGGRGVSDEAYQKLNLEAYLKRDDEPALKKAA
jgi:hypothetical protein